MILRRYMTRQVASTTALVLGFLLVLLLGGRMIRYFGIAAEGRLDVGLLFAIIGYNLPYFLELVLPLSFFIGLMLVFGRLYVDHEMAVLNSSGISRGRLARLMMPLILILFVFEAGLSLYAKPWGVRNTDTIWHQQSLSSAFDLIRPQSFISSDDYHLYVGGMNEDRTELQDVILIQTAKVKDTKLEDKIPDSETLPTEQVTQDENNLGNNHANIGNNQATIKTTTNTIEPTTSVETAKAENEVSNAVLNNELNNDALSNKIIESSNPARDTVILAKRAMQVQGGEDSNKTQLDLYQGRRYEVAANSLVYNQVSFERYRISLERPPADVLTDDNVTTQPLPVVWKAATGNDLLFYNDTKVPELISSESTNQVIAAQAELGYRLALPWLIFIAPMLAVPLAQVRPRQGRWLRLVPAILIFTSCALVIISIKSSVMKGTVPVWINAVAIFAFMALALYFNWASRIHHRVKFRLGQRELQKQNNNVIHDDKTKGGRK